MANFQECVIIPLSMFERCNFRSSILDKSHPLTTITDTLDKSPSSILHDESLPSDIKMKLYQQEKRLKTSSKNPIVTSSVQPPPVGDTESILQDFTSKNYQRASEILHKIYSKPAIISWNEKLEVRINKKLFPNSNIIELLRYLLREPDADSPPTAQFEFRTALKHLGVNPTWMRKSSLKPTTSQVGFGWVRY